jgi:hypothetical protein
MEKYYMVIGRKRFLHGKLNVNLYLLRLSINLSSFCHLYNPRIVHERKKESMDTT